MAHILENVVGQRKPHTFAGGLRNGVYRAERRINPPHKLLHAALLSRARKAQMPGDFRLRFEIEQIVGASEVVVHIVSDPQKKAVRAPYGLVLRHRNYRAGNKLEKIVGAEVEQRLPAHCLCVAQAAYAVFYVRLLKIGRPSALGVAVALEPHKLVEMRVLAGGAKRAEAAAELCVKRGVAADQTRIEH